MSETTRISWTDATWNPWIGCRKVSPGCKNCYAERLVRDRMGRDFREIRRSSERTFRMPLRLKGRKRVFTCSISDFFIEEADAWRPEAWEIIKRTPQLTYQILTKRPERIIYSLPDDWGLGYSNVWLGTSVENQEYAEKRIPLLLEVPAKVRFLSCEPLLGKLDLTKWLLGTCGYYCDEDNGHIDHDYPIHWIIVGGESGPNYREMKEEWAVSLKWQCVWQFVPFFFKQHSGPRSEMGPALEGREYREMPKAWSESSERL